MMRGFFSDLKTIFFILKEIIQLNYLDLKIGWVIEAFYFSNLRE